MLSREWYEKIKKDRVWKKLQKIEAAFSASEVDLSVLYKLRIAEFVLRLKKRFQKPFGLYVIFGWHGRWSRYADISDVSQDIFKKHRVHIFEMRQRAAQDLGYQRFISHHLRELINFDGAILINKHGVIVASGVYIEGLRPRAVAKKIHPESAGDLSVKFSFKKKVHARHLAAITSSFVFKNTTVFTLSEETGDFHIFENGKIVYSTVKGEMPGEIKKTA